ncbi:GMC oxidoreductase [Patellaria atrata CBS 101060]|uniref:GMC oxidoreductase n=1 Tax=Patellaria atrata CBS 101060 TaxID=1346257 RepID=A0A9P4SL65_9PEZI|nr:GMC oxidoreductase [Patellaria atrata CBS 101060]
MGFSSGFLAVAGSLVFSQLSSAYPALVHQIRNRAVDIADIKESYDYIVVGGGQSGLVVANRLSEDSNYSVLVVEYGYFDDNPAQLDPSSAARYPAGDLFNLSSVPQLGLNGQPKGVYAANVVGGGSTVNGMFLNRGSARDYNDWEALGNKGWGWSDLLPYFKKSTHFLEPDPELAAEFNITYDIDAAFGRDGPIFISYPSFQYPGIKPQWKAWAEIGVPQQIEGSDGSAYGAIWIPNAFDRTVRRSYSRSGYYEPAKNRTNLELIVGQRVNEVLFDENKRATGVTIQERGGENIVTVSAKKEIVLTAGFLHTPQILQRSGIGPKALLEQAGIEVISDLPGVGSNFQDHPVSQASVTYETDMQPNPNSLVQNRTFRDWADKEWAENRRGPRSIGVGNSAALVPYPVMNPDSWQEVVDAYKAQNVADYLPSTYNEINIKGYEAQRAVMSTSLGLNDNAFTEIPFSGSGSVSLVLTRPLSRGTVLLKPDAIYDEPTVDYNTLINPTDVQVQVDAVKTFRRWMNATSMQVLSPSETAPGKTVTTDEQIANSLRRGMGPSTAHGCCTATMMPKENAGVVSPELLVYGVTGLSVADTAVIPLIPATHICATVYAVAEKAADLIKSRR